MDTLSGLRRTDYCAKFDMKGVGREITVFGWTQRRRSLGGLIFIDLRDRSGIIQLAFDDSTQKDLFEKAGTVKSEYVLAAKGSVRERSSKNKEIPTGDIEVFVTDLRILGRSETPPFEIIDDCLTGETARLKYRYLDLRRPALQNNILFRNKVTHIVRNYFYENGFIDLETPMLMKSTPEGARDFLVPSRLHHGTFYALPQSPQLYKQLSMVAGFDRYIQLARCFRDEDSRADRHPEFTQIDMEMSLVDVEDVIDIGEGLIKRVFSEAMGVELPDHVPRLTYTEAMESYGTDKPDTRYEMKLFDLAPALENSGFAVFDDTIAAGGAVRAFTAKNAFKILTRKEIDKLTDMAKGSGAKGLAWIRIGEDGVSSSFGKFLAPGVMDKILETAGAGTDDVVLIVGDRKKSLALSVLGALRCACAEKLGLVTDAFNVLWITEFPFFDWDEDAGQYVAMHHPFTAPLDECVDYLETDKANVRAKCYDLVLNGIELASGSIRITDPELQKRIFALLDMSDEEANAKFGFLLDAFRFGPPPHGGMGIGLDRLVMQMLRAPSLRDVIPYPKLKDATEAMSECPSEVDPAQLEELGIAIVENDKES